jgi:hypothetical protein
MSRDRLPNRIQLLVIIIIIIITTTTTTTTIYVVTVVVVAAAAAVNRYLTHHIFKTGDRFENFIPGKHMHFFDDIFVMNCSVIFYSGGGNYTSAPFTGSSMAIVAVFSVRFHRHTENPLLWEITLRYITIL